MPKGLKPVLIKRWRRHSGNRVLRFEIMYNNSFLNTRHSSGYPIKPLRKGFDHFQFLIWGRSWVELGSKTEIPTVEIQYKDNYSMRKASLNYTGSWTLPIPRDNQWERKGGIIKGTFLPVWCAFTSRWRPRMNSQGPMRTHERHPVQRNPTKCKRS